MSSFTEPLILEALPCEERGRGLFTVYKEFRYEIGHLGSGDLVVVPAGFQTDLASIPAIARAFIPLAGRCAKPALVHDWMLIAGDPRAHDVFYETLTIAGLPPFKRWIMVESVRLWSKWKALGERARNLLNRYS